jgi:glyoxylase-like metal-dependent hydrolase (beta-lactamase superfamily II)
VSGVNALIGTCDSPLHVLAHVEDEINRQFLPQQANMMQFEYSGAFNVSQTVAHHDEVCVGEHSFQVLHTPGHAIGHVSFFTTNTDNLYNAPLLLAGDALFQGSIGRTDLPGGNHQQLIASIQNELFCLPEQTVVCPGHGPNTTIGHEKKTNPFF